MAEKISFSSLPTPISNEGRHKLWNGNNLYVKRDDLTGFALGGNKSRKLEYFFYDAVVQKSNHIVTYGALQSNHCRMTAAAASKMGMDFTMIVPETDEKPTYEGNYKITSLMGVNLIATPLNQVKTTITETLSSLKTLGDAPYFIPGGGHGYLGTLGYVEAYREIESQKQHNLVPRDIDYIFLASGTGATQAGLIVGSGLCNNAEKIVGISIARAYKQGIQPIKESINEYNNINKTDIKTNKIVFEDKYIGSGYGDVYTEIETTIKKVAKLTSIILDPIYTGKAFYGMLDYLDRNSIKNKNVIFIHTGGIPLFFNKSSF
ncbi:1-aminocyclopropane-1-carboxylate deaminase/D-cysteine desulfhydrase [Shouchella patagoniensis]|uniref:1-aminocyclopropane-1-carboxylate deaminase/D-cysteine desulfhydrase n=1 Tax=Shouchella patagoniensis TaxID=228576 RepID=UPI000994D74D|nr:pyridoxal-phosphate dependent enzyme [Shouchella patagoniensis]